MEGASQGHRAPLSSGRPWPAAQAGQPLLSVESLRTSYAQREGGLFHAVDDVSFQIAPGETLDLVGESGCGKSSLSRTLTRLIPSSAGRIVFNGVDLAPLREREIKPWRRCIQMVFQDPYASLNPRRNVHDTLDAVLRLHEPLDARARAALIRQTLERVGCLRRRRAAFPTNSRAASGSASALRER